MSGKYFGKTGIDFSIRTPFDLSVTRGESKRLSLDFDIEQFVFFSGSPEVSSEPLYRSDQVTMSIWYILVVILVYSWLLLQR
jgi:hypothetical protein